MPLSVGNSKSVFSAFDEIVNVALRYGIKVAALKIAQIVSPVSEAGHSGMWRFEGASFDEVLEACY